MSSDVIDLDVEQEASRAETLVFRHAMRLVQGTRIAAAAAVLLFVAALLAGSAATLTLLLLVAVGIAAAAALDVHRRTAVRPDTIEVAPEGLTQRRGTRPRSTSWSDVAILTHEVQRGRIVCVTHDGVRSHIDADLEQGIGALLAAAAVHLDDSRREPASPALERAPRPASFPRAPWAEGAALGTTMLGVLLGLTAAPVLFVLALIGLPALVWCWLKEPHRVVVDDSAVRIVNRFTRDVLPIRAIRGCTLTVHGRVPGFAVVVQHRERGPILLRGFGTHALPLFDAIRAALSAQQAQRTGAAGASSSRTVVRTPALRSGRRTAAILAAALLLATWATLLTGLPLRTAVQHGSASLMRVALLFGSPRNSADDSGLAPLHHAARLNEEAMVRRLIRSGARIDLLDGNGATPLHVAAEAGAEAAARALIEAGADVHARDARGRTPLARALTATTTHDVALARALLDAGAAPNAPDADGRTPMHHAAANAHAAWIPLLARARGNPNARDIAGNSPVHLAAHAHHVKTIDALVAAGADVNARGPGGRTALAAAAGDANTPPAVTDALLSARARVDIADDEGWNAVQRAAAINHATALEQFARRRVPVDATTGGLPPALHIAIRRHNVEAVRALLRAGASPSRRFDGVSAYDVARVTGNPTISALVRMR
jgi:ankyrin repeat protein